MIQIQLEYLAIVYLLALLAFIGLLWMVYERRRRRRDFKLREGVVCCSTCNQVFQTYDSSGLVTCPYCKSLNEKKSFEHL